MDKKNILVTGALGHIGSKLIREYAYRKDIGTIKIYDDLSTNRYCSLFNLPSGVGANATYEFIEGDIHDDKLLRKSLEGIDTVIHLAAITDAPSTINRRDETFYINFEGTQKVLKASIDAGVNKFLFPSTTSVYGETEGLVDEEFSGYKPSTPYAEAKLAAEKAVCQAGKNEINTNVLRMGTIFGSSIGMRFHTAVNKFAYLTALGKPVTVWKDAYDQKRPYLGINDDIRAFQFLEKNGKSGEVYNILTENYTVRQIVDTVKKQANVDVKMVNSPIINQKSYEVSNRKIRNLGFEFQDNLDLLVAETMGLFKSIKNTQ